MKEEHIEKETSQEQEIRTLEFDMASAQRWAKTGRLEEWVHRYLLAGSWANPEFSEGLKLATRWWRGPVEIDTADLTPAVGPSPEMEYVVDEKEWQARTGALAESFTRPSALPPLIVEYRAGELSVRDGNTRLGAMGLLGWTKCWVIIWYNSEEDYISHKARLNH